MSTLNLALLSDPQVNLASRVLVGLVLLIAGVTKIQNATSFRGSVQGYKLLPRPLVGPVATALPWIECLVALSLPFGATMPWSAVAAGGLLLLFSAAVAINIARGNREIDCGCFGAHRQRLSWWLIVRNGLLLALVALALYQPGAAPWQALTRAPDAATAALTPLEVAVSAGIAGAALLIWQLGQLSFRLWQPPDDWQREWK